MSLTNSAEKPRICECRGLAAGVYSQPAEPNSTVERKVMFLGTLLPVLPRPVEPNSMRVGCSERPSLPLFPPNPCSPHGAGVFN